MNTAWPLLFLLLVPVYGAEFPEYPVKSVAEYDAVTVQSGIAVAVAPMYDEREQRKYFGARLRPRGYVPVFVVIENRNSGVSYVFRKEAIRGGPDGTSTPPRAGRHAGTETALEITGATSIVLSVPAAAMLSKISERRHNIIKTEIRSATIAPSSSVHGFIFIPAKWRRTASDRVKLSIPFTEAGADTTIEVNCLF